MSSEEAELIKTACYVASLAGQIELGTKSGTKVYKGWASVRKAVLKYAEAQNPGEDDDDVGTCESEGEGKADGVEQWSQGRMQELISKESNLKAMKDGVTFIQQNNPDMPVQCHMAALSATNACLMCAMQSLQEKKPEVQFIQDRDVLDVIVGHAWDVVSNIMSDELCELIQTIEALSEVERFSDSLSTPTATTCVGDYITFKHSANSETFRTPWTLAILLFLFAPLLEGLGERSDGERREDRSGEALLVRVV
eukprot:9472610-Pyramimonas_sp.AAC.1